MIIGQGTFSFLFEFTRHIHELRRKVSLPPKYNQHKIELTFHASTHTRARARTHARTHAHFKHEHENLYLSRALDAAPVNCQATHTRRNWNTGNIIHQSNNTLSKFHTTPYNNIRGFSLQILCSPWTLLYFRNCVTVARYYIRYDGQILIFRWDWFPCYQVHGEFPTRLKTPTAGVWGRCLSLRGVTLL